MSFWPAFYLCASFPTLVLSLASRRRKVSVAGVIVFLSWVMTNTVLMSHGPSKTFLIYFAFDMIVAEIMLYMLLHRFTVWNAIFLTATICQLFIHLYYWSSEPPPRRYHELLNIFYWPQFLVTMVTSFFPEAEPVLKMRRQPIVLWTTGTLQGGVSSRKRACWLF